MADTRKGRKTSSIDWFYQFSFPIGSEDRAEDGLRRRRRSIEEIVAPYITARKTCAAIRFKGELRYVKRIKSEEEQRKVWHAIEVLQGIYHLQDAWQEGDIEDAIRLAYAIGWLDTALVAAERFRCPLYTDVLTWINSRNRGRKKRGKTKLASVRDVLLQTAYANNRGRKDWLRQTMAELVQRHNVNAVSTKTLSRHLKQRGITDK